MEIDWQDIYCAKPKLNDPKRETFGWKGGKGKNAFNISYQAFNDKYHISKTDVYYQWSANTLNLGTVKFLWVDNQQLKGQNNRISTLTGECYNTINMIGKDIYNWINQIKCPDNAFIKTQVNLVQLIGTVNWQSPCLYQLTHRHSYFMLLWSAFHLTFHERTN